MTIYKSKEQFSSTQRKYLFLSVQENILKIHISMPASKWCVKVCTYPSLNYKDSNSKRENRGLA